MAIQIPDKPNDDLSLIRCYAFNEPNLSMNDFGERPTFADV